MGQNGSKAKTAATPARAAEPTRAPAPVVKPTPAPVAEPTPAPAPVAEATPAPQAEKKKISLMLCGSGESGKTTFVKQIKLHFLGGISNAEMQSNFKTIRGNLIETIQLLMSWAKANNDDPGFEDPELAGEIAELAPFATKFDADLAENLRCLWADPVIQEAFENRDKTAVPDHMSYFFDKLDSLEDDNYQMLIEDVLKARVRSLGCDKFTFDIEQLNLEVTLIDLGGQKNERCRWDEWQTKVDGAIFFSPLADFDKPMFEEVQYKARMHDSLECFQDIAHRSAFKNKPIFLICNKIDGFNDKIKNSEDEPFCKVFDEYSGDPTNPEECYKYVHDMFMERAKGSPARYIKIFSQNSIDQESAGKNAEAIFKMISEL